MNKSFTKTGIHVLILLGAIACFAFFQFCYPYHLFYQEQNQLFLWSWDYALTYLAKPGCLACWMGDFLTQFYYYRYAGPAILTLSILLTGCLTRYAVQGAGIKGLWIPSIIAFAMMSLLVCHSFHYDYRLSSILAIAGGAGLFCGTTMLLKLLHNRWLSLVCVFLNVFICHWLFGMGVWIYGILVVISCLSYIMRADIYYFLAALIIPFFLILLTKRHYVCDYYTLYTYPGVGKILKPQMDLEKTLGVDCEYYFGNYNKVLKMIESNENPDLYVKFYYNLIMAQNRSLSATLLKYPDNNLGTFDTLGPDTPPLTIKTINELYWILGDMTFCERAAMLANVCSPNNRNIRMMKRLAEINLVKGDYNATRKYLRILQKTFVWKGWANRVFAALGHHASQEEHALIQPYIDKHPFINTKDTLRTSDNCYIIMKELVESNPANNIAINYMLCSDLLLKDMDTFKHDYDAYYLKQKSVLYDRLYQEALMIYLAGTKAKPEEWNRYIKQPELLQRFRQYSQQRGNPAFSDTYWYYFDKAEIPTLNNK